MPERQDFATFDRQLTEAVDASLAALRQASDDRRVKNLVRKLNATLAGQTQVDSILALTRVLGGWSRAMPPDEAVTALAVVVKLISTEMLGDA